MDTDYKIAQFSFLLRKSYTFMGEFCIRMKKHKQEIRAPSAKSPLPANSNM